MLKIVAFVITVIAHSIFHALAEGFVRVLIRTIHKTDIAAAEHVAVTVGHTGYRTDFTAVYTHFGLTEYVTVIMK